MQPRSTRNDHIARDQREARHFRHLPQASLSERLAEAAQMPDAPLPSLPPVTPLLAQSNQGILQGVPDVGNARSVSVVPTLAIPGLGGPSAEGSRQDNTLGPIDPFSVAPQPARSLPTASPHAGDASSPMHPSSGIPRRSVTPLAHSSPAATFESARPAELAPHQTSTPQCSQVRQTTALEHDEEMGLRYMASVMQEGFDNEAIGDDDWEDIVDDGDQPLDTEPNIPAPVDSEDHGDDDENDENDPDPFYIAPAHEQCSQASERMDSSSLTYIFYLIVVWLHVEFHLPHRACNALLKIITIIMRAAGVTLDPELRSTLNTAVTSLDAEANFLLLPTCIKCRDVFPPSVAICDQCNMPLCHAEPTPQQRAEGKQTRDDHKPRIPFAYLPLEDQLRSAFESTPGLEDVVDDWRKQKRTEGVYKDIWDGRVCKELKGDDGLPFFRHDLPEMPKGELRIGVTLGIDWYVCMCYAFAFTESVNPVGSHTFEAKSLPRTLHALYLSI